MSDSDYTHEGIVIKLYGFTGCTDNDVSPRTVKLRETPKFWRDESGVLYSKSNGWPRGRHNWRLKIDSVKRIDAGKDAK